jgi:hypothetical protein
VRGAVHTHDDRSLAGGHDLIPFRVRATAAVAAAGSGRRPGPG